MPQAVICNPIRTPVGRYQGALAALQTADLGAGLLRTLMKRTQLDPALVDDVLLGNCYPSSEAPAIGRVVALDAGLPVSTPGLQIDRRCGSGLQAVVFACLLVEAGLAELVVAGGVESMSNVQYYTTDMRTSPGAVVNLHDGLARARMTAGGRYYPLYGGMLETAENLRRRYEITRAQQDQLAVSSHQRAAAAQDEGLFVDEIVPVQVGRELVTADEHPRRGVTKESLAALRPVLGHTDPEATVTAGNASGQNDGAALCLVTHRDFADRHGLVPAVRMVSTATAGVDPAYMGVGPVPATAAALRKAGLTMADMDLVELNEAFAAQALACYREWGFGGTDLARVNVRGSGISLGHPVGATGVRILATLTHELARRDARYALETLCIGGGQGIAAVFERVA